MQVLVRNVQNIKEKYIQLLCEEFGTHLIGHISENSVLIEFLHQLVEVIDSLVYFPLSFLIFSVLNGK